MPVLLNDGSPGEQLLAAPVLIAASLAFSLACQMCGPNCATGADQRGARRAPSLVADFWPDGLGGGDEIVLLAHHLGVLETTTFDELAEAILERPIGRPLLRLAGERPEERDRIVGRIEELRRSARRRQGYVEMLRAVYEEFRPMWARTSARRLPRTIERYQAQLDRGVSWRTFFPTPKREMFLDKLFAEIGHDQSILLFPVAAMGSMFVLDLGDAVAIGLPLVEQEGADTEELAAGLKALAHPTRLAILGELRNGPVTVGQLASRFDLAQPTVTNHVKLLRQVGVVAPASGAGRGIELERDVLRSLTERLTELTEPGEPAGISG